VVAAAVVATLTAVWSLAGCGVPVDSQSHRIASGNVPFELLEPSETTTTAVPGASTSASSETEAPVATVSLYLVHNGAIERRSRVVSRHLSTEAQVMLLAQPVTAAEAADGFRTAVATGSVLGVATAGGVATVDLSPAFTEGRQMEQILGFAQITYMLTDMPGIGQVSFTLAGTPVQVLDGHGQLIAGPVTRETYATQVATLPPDTIDR
jgi:spore germination protein GerM